MKKVLIIEDEASLRKQLIEILGFEGYVAIGAKNGKVGIEVILDELPDVIVSDIAMPELDGYGVLKAVRSHPVMASIPFIFVSARATKDDIQQGLRLGADAYLTKPFRLEEFLQTIRRCLE